MSEIKTVTDYHVAKLSQSQEHNSFSRNLLAVQYMISLVVNVTLLSFIILSLLYQIIHTYVHTSYGNHDDTVTM